MKLLRTEADIMDAVKARIHELGITHETIDDISGMPSGYTSKLLCGMKGLGPKSWPFLLGALGMVLTIDVDPEQVARVQSRWVKRRRAIDKKKAASAARFSSPTIVQITPELQAQMEKREHMKYLGKLGGNASAKGRMKKMAKRARQRVATHAARMRWAKREAPTHA